MKDCNLKLTDKGLEYKKQLENELTQSEEGRAYLEKIKHLRICPECDYQLYLENLGTDLITCPKCQHTFINK